MKIKLLICSVFVLTFIATSSFAWNYLDENKSVTTDDNNINTNSNYDSGQKGYESSFGNRYEYDLNRPSDKIRYEVDPSAQLRDSIDVNPIRTIERDLGQSGGGVYND